MTAGPVRPRPPTVAPPPALSRSDGATRQARGGRACARGGWPLPPRLSPHGWCRCAGDRHWDRPFLPFPSVCRREGPSNLVCKGSGGRARVTVPMEEPLALHPVKLYVYDLSKGMARRLSHLMLGKSTAGDPGPHRPPSPGGSRFATDHCGPAFPRRKTGPKSPPPAPGVTIPARYRSPEGAARRGRLSEGAPGGGGVRRVQRGSVLGDAAGFGCGIPDPAVFGMSFVSAADAAALGPACSPAAARCCFAVGIS